MENKVFLVKVEQNEEKNGVELFFDGKPTETVIEFLKANHFRWHKAKKCWYNKRTEQTMQAVEQIISGHPITAQPTTPNEPKAQHEIKLKTLKKATLEQALEIAKLQWDRQDMQDYLIKNYDFYLTEDKMIIEIEKASKLSITKELYYDDEYEAPQVNFDNFLEYNKHNCNRYDYYNSEQNTQFYFCKQNAHCVYIDKFDNYNMLEPLSSIRAVTQEEFEDILEIYKKQKEQYLERLQKYFTRYGKHIRTHGYWANR